MGVYWDLHPVPGSAPIWRACPNTVQPNSNADSQDKKSVVSTNQGTIATKDPRPTTTLGTNQDPKIKVRPLAHTKVCHRGMTRVTSCTFGIEQITPRESSGEVVTVAGGCERPAAVISPAPLSASDRRPKLGNCGALSGETSPVATHCPVKHRLSPVAWTWNGHNC